MARRVEPVRDGYHTAVPSLVVRDAAKAIEFYREAFGATEGVRMLGPDGKSILHSELQIGDSKIFVNDEDQSMGSRSPESLHGTTGAIHLNVEDTDALFERAVRAGAKPLMPPMDMYWGDRHARIVDPFGHEWGIGTHQEDLSPEEIRDRGEAFFRSSAARRR